MMLIEIPLEIVNLVPDAIADDTGVADLAAEPKVVSKQGLSLKSSAASGSVIAIFPFINFNRLSTSWRWHYS